MNEMLRRLNLDPRLLPVYALIAASGAGLILYESGEADAILGSSRWSPLYLLIAPFMHAGLAHFILNAMALYIIGGQMMLPVLRTRRFLLVFAAGALGGEVANNLLTQSPAVGISAAVLALLSCALFPFGRAPMKFLLLHDLLRLPPFPLWSMAALIVALDIAGLIFEWSFFAHWGHLAGFASGAVAGFFIFRRRPRHLH